MRVLDVGCGPGRHARALAERGIDVVGVDISPRFVELAAEGAPPNATFVVGDARALDYDEEFDVVISLCQGGFGLVRGDDATVLEGMARAVKPGTGRLALTAFSAYFAVRYLEPTDDFDAATGVNVEQTTLKNSEGDEIPFELDTTCFTPRELRLLCAAAGLEVEHLWSVTPGAYATDPPDLDHPEFLLLARRPA
jgi:SAM-dependent methyltransferase